jgi:hypothetical protein
MRGKIGGVLRLTLALGVILGWFLALTWMIVSVTQIAVERTVFPTCAVSAPGEIAC